MLQAGDLGIDYSGWRMDTARKVSEMRKAKGRFIIRYSAGVGNTSKGTRWKLCGKDEISEAVARGFDFIANSEWYESRVTEGAKAGKADGKADRKFWRSRGLAKGASIYVSWDAHPDNDKWPKVVAYLKAFNKALRGYYHVDCYAGTPFLEHAKKLGVIRFGWRPNAGYWSGDGLPYAPDDALQHAAHATEATPAHLWQTGNYWFGKNADENLILRTPVGSHLEALDGGIVALSSKDIDRIAKRVLDLDVIPSSPPNKDNPTRTLGYYVRSLRLIGLSTRDDVRGNGKLLAEALKRVAELQQTVADLTELVKASSTTGSTLNLDDVTVAGKLHFDTEEAK